MHDLSEENLKKVAGGVSDIYDDKKKIYEDKLSLILKEERGIHTAVIGECPVCGTENRMGGNRVCMNCKIKKLRKEIFGEESTSGLNQIK